MANARGSVGARGLCHRSAGPPGLSISESDPESATVSRERRRVNMAAREVGQVVNDELAALRLQVASLQQLVELVFAKVSMFVPIVPVPVAQPHQYMAVAPEGKSDDKQQRDQRSSVEPEHELSPQRFSGASIPSPRPLSPPKVPPTNNVSVGDNMCPVQLFDIFETATAVCTQTDPMYSDSVHVCKQTSFAPCVDDENDDDQVEEEDGDYEEVVKCGKWQPLVRKVVDVRRRRSQIPALCEKIADSIKFEVDDLRAQNLYQEYKELVLKRFAAVFSLCPNHPITTLKRNAFDEKYGAIHRSGIWHAVCKNYHSGTGDPLSKSDCFLNVMRKIHLMWHKEEEFEHGRIPRGTSDCKRSAHLVSS